VKSLLTIFFTLFLISPTLAVEVTDLGERKRCPEGSYATYSCGIGSGTVKSCKKEDGFRQGNTVLYSCNSNTRSDASPSCPKAILLCQNKTTRKITGFFISKNDVYAKPSAIVLKNTTSFFLGGGWGYTSTPSFHSALLTGGALFGNEVHRLQVTSILGMGFHDLYSAEFGVHIQYRHQTREWVGFSIGPGAQVLAGNDEIGNPGIFGLGLPLGVTFTKWVDLGIQFIPQYSWWEAYDKAKGSAKNWVHEESGFSYRLLMTITKTFGGEK
jgi:hypothetical protein